MRSLCHPDPTLGMLLTDWLSLGQGLTCPVASDSGLPPVARPGFRTFSWVCYIRAIREICHHDAGPLDGEGNPAVNFITAFI